MDVGSWRGNKVQGITVYTVPLAVILIWRFGGFSSDLQIKITANIVVLSQVLINSNDEQACPPICFPSQIAKLSAKCTTHTVFFLV